MKLLTHAADLHTPTLEPTISRRVAESLGEEFAAQAELEKNAGQPVTVMLSNTLQQKASLELGFIRFVVRPLWAQLVALLPDLAVFLDRMVRARTTIFFPSASSFSGEFLSTCRWTNLPVVSCVCCVTGPYSGRRSSGCNGGDVESYRVDDAGQKTVPGCSGQEDERKHRSRWRRGTRQRAQQRSRAIPQRFGRAKRAPTHLQLCRARAA